MSSLLEFCLIVGVGAGLLIILDLLSGQEEPFEAIWAKEIWILYWANVLIAGLLTYTLIAMNQIGLGFLTGMAVVFGYPLLVHTKFLTVRVSPNQSIPIGFELVFEQITNVLKPGIEQSVRERGVRYLEEFLKRPMDDLTIRAKNYLTPMTIFPPHVKESKEDLHNWLDRLREDVQQSPEREDQAKRLIFTKIQSVGGYRAVKYCIQR